MDERWRILARVHDLRARLASNEAAQRRQVEVRAQAALEQARQLKARYEEFAARTSLGALLHGRDSGTTRFNAAEAQTLLSYSASARLKAQEATGPIRRAQLICQHAQVAANEAGEKYRRTAARREAVVSHLQGRWKSHLQQQLERQDEALAEARSSYVRVTDGGQ